MVLGANPAVKMYSAGFSFATVLYRLGTPEQQRWADAFRPSNPQSPQVTLGPSAEAAIEIRAVSFVSPQVASVRFRRTLRRAQQIEQTDWVATAAFDYSRAPMAEADRLRNPLGFQVTSYRADAEAIR